MRREISSDWLSLTAAGAVRSELSIVITTSAWLRAGRLPEPAKITASMSAARSDLCEVSPIAQRNASTRLDLPQPFGPTTPVRPGSITKSVGSTNDLKPWRRRRVSFIGTDSLLAGRESPCRDNTIEGNVGVWGESLEAALAGPTMARRPPLGNRRGRLFPREINRFIPRFIGGWDPLGFPWNRLVFEQRLDPPVEFLERGHARDLVAIDKECWRRIDL